jgi:UDP-2-acetamido-3-amino-2,3-dideoxy-glucuronate N-acetyltransferase
MTQRAVGPPRVHPTAIIEDGVVVGDGTSIWDSVHIRGPGTSIGSECVIGEKTYVAYGVTIRDRVKINAFVYICTAVTIETGAFVAAGVVFTNDVHPRATTPDLATLLPSEPDEQTRPTTVGEGATIGARTVVGCDLRLGRFSMTGMGSVVTRSIGDFYVVVGSPARCVGYVCRCGTPLVRFDAEQHVDGSVQCLKCGRSYDALAGRVEELQPGEERP